MEIVDLQSGRRSFTKMSISIEQMRGALKTLYRGASKWVTKVECMSDRQVYAVYMRMLESGKFSKT